MTYRSTYPSPSTMRRAVKAAGGHFSRRPDGTTAWIFGPTRVGGDARAFGVLADAYDASFEVAEERAGERRFQRALHHGSNVPIWTR